MVLTVIDADGQVATTKQRVAVAPIAYRASAPSAVFAAPSGHAGSPVAFDAGRSSDANPGGTLSYRWTFGDGGVGAGAHVEHAFRGGTWTVTLTVTDNASGLSNSVSHQVTISPVACVVPALRGKLLAAARRALQAAHCSLGRTTTPKRPARSPGKHKRWQLVVASQSTRAGRSAPKGPRSASRSSGAQWPFRALRRSKYGQKSLKLRRGGVDFCRGSDALGRIRNLGG